MSQREAKIIYLGRPSTAQDRAETRKARNNRVKNIGDEIAHKVHGLGEHVADDVDYYAQLQ